MSDKYDINRLISEANSSLGNIDPSTVPLLGQQVPVMHGLPVNGKLLTIYDLEKMSEIEFRELFLAAIITLSGALYAPPPKTTPDEDPETDTE